MRDVGTCQSMAYRIFLKCLLECVYLIYVLNVKIKSNTINDVGIG